MNTVATVAHLQGKFWFERFQHAVHAGASGFELVNPAGRWASVSSSRVRPSQRENLERDATSDASARAGNAGKRAITMRGNGKRIAGKNYRPSCGRCGVPHWELCACSSAELIALNARTVAPVVIEAAERISDKINSEALLRFQLALET